MADVETPPEKSLEEQDREWLETVYRGGKEPQLTARAIIVGMLFGGLMSLSNLYIGLKSGWGLGVDITAIIVIFAVFKGLEGIGLVRRPFGMMESTIMMTVAVAASWISSAGLVSAVPALTMLTGYTFIWWQLAAFIGITLYLGLFMAIPLKRQMISVDKLRFPANIPTAETLKAMYVHGGEAMKKAKALGAAGLVGMAIAALRDGLHWIPSQIALPVSIRGTAMSRLTLSFEPSLIFIGIGGLFGIKVGLSMLAGFALNYGVLAPRLIEQGVIRHAAPVVSAARPAQLPLSVSAGQSFTVELEEVSPGPPEYSSGVSARTLRYTWTEAASYTRLEELQRDLNSPRLLDGSPNPLAGVIRLGDAEGRGSPDRLLTIEAPAAVIREAHLSIPEAQPPGIIKGLGFEPGAARTQLVGGFRNISAWSLWPGATILVVGGLLGLAFKWRTLGRTFGSIFSGLRGDRGGPKGVLDHLEVPMRWFLPGFAVTGLAATLMLMWMFHIRWWMGIVAVLMSFLLAAVAARAAAEIGINPVGALGKVTQLSFGALAPGDVAANLMTAGVTAGASGACSDTVGNLKVGHMVGANPRKQFVAQLFGVFAGAMLAVPTYFVLVPDPNALGGDKFPAPSALIWMGVARVLSQGLRTLPPSAVWAMGVAFALGVVIVVIDSLYPGARPYTPSPAALGIALTIPAYTSFSMFLGSAIVFLLERRAGKWNETYTIPVASGCIGGESIMGVILAVLIAAGMLE